jgi:hypothetical protein
MSELASESASTAHPRMRPTSASEEVPFAEKSEAREVLQAVWTSTSQGAADLDDCDTGQACRKMTDAGVGYDDFGGATEEARASSWRARLEREGKLSSSGGSLRDLVFGTGSASGTGKASGTSRVSGTGRTR